MNPVWRNLMMVGLVTMLALFALGCEYDEEVAQLDEEGVVNVTAGEGYFEPDAISVEQGQEVTVEIENVDEADHTFTIDEYDIDVSLAPEAQEEITFTATEEGTFEFYCDEPGHRDAGMYGHLGVGEEPVVPDDDDDDNDYNGGY